MKGLLLKDYYLIGSVLWILLAAMAVIGIAMAVLTSAWALVVIATVMLGMVSVSTINMDKASGWYKVSLVMPVARQAVVDSKYLLYLLLSGVGLFAGHGPGDGGLPDPRGAERGGGPAVPDHQCGHGPAGGGASPCPAASCSPRKRMCWPSSWPIPAAAGIFAGVVVPLGVTPLSGAWWRGISVVLYAASWVLARRKIAFRDVA